jgi:hypothetical protein
VAKKIYAKSGRDGIIYILLKDFKDLIDVNKITHYRIKSKKGGPLTIRFYDKNKKLVKPYESK